MPDTPYVLFAFWGPRQENAELCAGRLQKMLNSLVEIHPALVHWSTATGPRNDLTFHSTPLTAEQLSEIIRQNQVMTDTPGVAMPQLGFRLMFLNERSDAQAVRLSVNVGAYAPRPPEPNSIHCQFRSRSADNADLLTAEILTKVLDVVSSAWEATWASVMPWDYPKRTAKPDGTYMQPWAGWITYLCPRYAGLVSPSPSITSVPASGGGLILLATREPFDIENSTHTSSADAIQAALAPLQFQYPRRGP